jgi:hypothetical protein
MSSVTSDGRYVVGNGRRGKAGLDELRSLPAEANSTKLTAMAVLQMEQRNAIRN